MHDFDGIATKMRHAQAHLADLNEDFKRFRAGKSYEIRTVVDLEARRKKAVFYPTAPLPLDWSVVLGEALYDLRSSLDHLVYVMTKKYRPETLGRWTAFPVCLTEASFEGSGPRDTRSGKYKLRGMPLEAIEIIQRIQPYKVQAPNVPEQTTLAVFDDLANIDKHRTLNLCRMRTSEVRAQPRDGELSVHSMFWSMPGELEAGTVLAVWQPVGELNDEADWDMEIDFDVALDDGGPTVSHNAAITRSVDEFGTLINEILKALRPIHDKT